MAYRNWLHMLIEDQRDSEPISVMCIERTDAPVCDEAWWVALLDTSDPRILTKFDEMECLPVEMERLPLAYGSVLVYSRVVRLRDADEQAAA